MASLSFFTYEMFPISPGGMGTLLSHSVRALLNQGHEISLVIDVSKDLVNRFRDEYLPLFPRAEAFKVYCLQELSEERPCPYIANRFQYKSVQFARALDALLKKRRIDFVEFFEYTGIAAEAVRRKRFEGSFADTVLAIRTHLSIDQIDGEEATKPLDVDRYVMYQMEHFALQLADMVLCPSKSWAETCQYRYGIDPGSIEISPPCFVPTYGISERAAKPDTVLFVGRLFQFKGVDLLVDAAVEVMRTMPEFQGRFVLCGYDSNESPVGGSFQEYLTRRIPSELRGRVEFAGLVSHEVLGQLSGRALCAVFPSYIESFCYAAHEAYEAGVPVLLGDIPAFKDCFTHEKNCLKFGHSSREIAECVRRIAKDATLRQRISDTRLPRSAALGRAYDDDTIAAYRLSSCPGPGMLKTRGALTKVDVLITTPTIGVKSADSSPECRDTLDSLRSATGVAITPWVLPLGTEEELLQGRASAVLSAERAVCRAEAGEGLLPAEGILTGDAAIFLEAGDTVEPEFWHRAIGILGHPDVGFVSAWRRLQTSGHGQPELEAYPFDWLTWEYPVFVGCRPMRCLFPIQPPVRLSELFDVRAGEFGEWHHLASTMKSGLRGYTISEPLLTIANSEPRWGREQQRPFVYHHLTRDAQLNSGALLVALMNEMRLAAHVTLGDSSARMALTEQEGHLHRIARLEAELDWFKGSRVLKWARVVGLGPLAKPMPPG